MSDADSPRRVETAEIGRGRDGASIRLDRRLYFQFLAFSGCRDTQALVGALSGAGVPGALYEDINDPLGVGLLTFSEEPGYFLDVLRPVLRATSFEGLVAKPELTMLGRTYARGYEQDLEEAVSERPKRRVLDPGLRWVVWYPLRRSGAFARLEEKEQRSILAEHGAIGHAFGASRLAYDVRLDSRGLNRDDNDFVIGILGRELHPLSKVVEQMRSTRQTSQYLERLGPFFTGRVFQQFPEAGERTDSRRSDAPEREGTA